MRQFTMHNAQFTIILVAYLTLFFTPLFAQSNLTYELHVGATGEVQVLADFPENYAGEKINIKVQSTTYDAQGEYDFVFTHEEPLEGFAEVYRFSDEQGTEWVVWRNSKEIKNRAQRTLVQNA